MFKTWPTSSSKLNITFLLFTLHAILIYHNVCAIIFDEVSSLHVWITISSLVSKDPSSKALLFRQVELNWINAPLEDEQDYIGLYLDSEAGDGNALPVSVHRLNGQVNGQIITDYYLPQIDFFNETNQLFANSTSGIQLDSLREKRISSFTQTKQTSLSNGETQIPSTQCIGYCLAYHSRGRILAKNCLRSSPNWMRDIYPLISSRSLTSLMLPGTHNSATYSKNLDKSVLNIINKYQLNQDETIFNQLVYGIRHLDLRVGYTKLKQHGERFWIYHDIFRTEVSVREVLEQVKRFLDSTSHEIIVMDFHRFTVGFQNENLQVQKERHSKLIELINKHLERYIIPAYLGQHAPLSEYINMGRRLIVGYANKANILGNLDYSLQLQASNKDKSGQAIRDIDAIKQDLENDQESVVFSSSRNRNQQQPEQEFDRRTGSRIFNKLKSFKLISNSFSKRSQKQMNLVGGGGGSSSRGSHVDSMSNEQTLMDYNDVNTNELVKGNLFFPSVRHLWPNQDTIDGLARYMNESTCRKYFGELRSLMVELTPTVFGALSDRYDGNRKMAQQVNRPVTDWIRDRWLHCVNIVASDYFLGNDLIQLAVLANRMRHSSGRHANNRNSFSESSKSQCESFRKIEHLLDKSRIPVQFVHKSGAELENSTHASKRAGNNNNDLIRHFSSNGNHIYLKPLTGSNFQLANNNLASFSGGRHERRESSFVSNMSDGFSNFFSSFKKLLNI